MAIQSWGTSNKPQATSGSGISSWARSEKEDEEERKRRNLAAKLRVKVDRGLDRGLSWEDISKKTGLDLNTIKTYSESTRPGYGITPEAPGRSLLEQGGDFGAGIVDRVGGGLVRGAVRLGALASEPLPGEQRKAAEGFIERNLENTTDFVGTSKDSLGGRVGNNLGTGLNTAIQIAGIGKAGSLARGGVRNVLPASRLGKAGTFATGSLAETAAAAANTTAQGNDVNLAREAGTGLAIDLGLRGAAPLVRGIVGRVKAPSIKTTKLGQLITETKAGKKLSSAKSEVGRYFVDNTNYIKKQFGNDVDESSEVFKGWKVKDAVSHLVTNVRQAAQTADASLDDNVGWQSLRDAFEGMSKRKGRQLKRELGSFISAKQNALNHNKLLEQGRIKGKPMQVPVGDEVQEAAYESLNQATKPVIQKLFDEGRITEPKYNEWMADTDYTRVQREVDDLLDDGFGAGSSLSPGAKGVPEQRLKGSTKKAVDPFASFLDWNRKTNTLIEQNKLTRYVRDRALEKGITKPIRVASKVIERMELYGEAAQLRPLRNKLGRVLKSQEGYARKIQSELNNLQKQARGEVERKIKKNIKGKIVPGEGVGADNIKGVIDQILSTDMATLNRLNKKFMAREPKLAKALQEITDIKGQYDLAKTEVNDLVQRARMLSDGDPLGEKTMTVFENGIRELYTVDPKVARQLKGVSDVSLGAIQNAALISSKILRAGATAFNTAFAAPNFIMDQVGSFAMSKNKFATHNPLVFLQSLKETAAKPLARATLGRVPGVKNAVTGLLEPSDAYKAWASKNKYMNRADLTRELKKATRQSDESLGVRGESAFRRVEGLISTTEETTRFQNYLGTLKKNMKGKNLTPAQAEALADEAARNNSINFSNKGELSTFMKIFNPYLNAGVQGSKTLAKSLKERPVSTSIAIATTTLAPVAYATYHNLSDPERARVYANLSESERRNNIVFVRDNGSVIKVPIPPGFRGFAQPLRDQIESEYIGDRQGLLETAKNLLLDPFSPVGTTKNELMANLIPQPIKPLAEVALNRDLYFGDDIVPENLKGLPKEEQAYDSTPNIYKELGKKLNISPLQIRKLITGYGAGGAEGILATSDQVRGKETGNRATTEQILRRFYRAPGDEGTQVKSTFYETYTPLKQKKEATSKKITAAIKSRDYQTANRLAAEVNEEIEKEKARLKNSYGKFETDLSVLYDQFDSLKFPLQGNRLSEASIRSRQRY